MHSPLFRRTAFLSGSSTVASIMCAVALLTPRPAFAEGGTILIEQAGDLKVVAPWTLSMPGNEIVERKDARLQIDSAKTGRYTLFVEPPTGETASIEVKVNDTLVETVSRPQVSFDLPEGGTAHLSIKLTLTHFGRVGVNSVPDGMPFDLKGPDGLLQTAVTPASFDKMPIGNYSVQYRPKGCLLPPPKSDFLKKDGSTYFTITLKCDSYEAETTSSESTHVTAQVRGETVTFSDVPDDSWFAPYVDTVAARGILTGYRNEAGESTGEFGPQNSVTLGELAKISHEMAEIDELDISDPPENVHAVGKWFTKYIASAEQLGWIVYQDPELDLMRPATRGEVIATFLQVLDIGVEWARGDLFTDVTQRTPYAREIETADIVGLVSGATDENGELTGEFFPLHPITRAEIAKILITVEEDFLKEPNEGM